MELGRSQRGLDLLNFFTAGIQTSFGAFVSSYLTTQGWSNGQIGSVLSIGTITSAASQIPAGAFVDRLENKRWAAAMAIVAIIFAALLLALFPTWLPVITAEMLHGFASCMVTPAVAAISLAVVSARGMSYGERLGRNALYGGLGNGGGAALMSATAQFISQRMVFFLAAALVLPALWSLTLIGSGRPAGSIAAKRDSAPKRDRKSVRDLLHDRRLLIFALAVGLFHLSNAAMLPMAASAITRSIGSRGSLIIGACIVLPQIIVAGLSPFIGRVAEQRGRKLLMVAGFAALPIRGVLLALITQPYAVVAIQLLDGISAAMFGVMLPLVVADITRGSGRFNLTFGAVGLAINAGAAISTTLAGFVADAVSPSAAFLTLAAAGLAASLVVLFFLPETRPKPGAREPEDMASAASAL